MKKFISIACLLALLLTAFGCGNPTDSETTASAITDAPDTTDEQTTEITEDTVIPETPVLVENGAAVFKITRPSDATGATIDGATSIVKKIKEISGISPKIQDDWVMEGQYDPSSLEILVGYCDRAESIYVTERTDYENYSIIGIGSKIVISAHSPALLSKACEYFNSHIESTDGKTVYTGGFTFSKSDNTGYLFNSGNSLKDYVITTDTSDPVLNRAASTLASAIRKCYGFRPEIKNITVAASEKEIYLGSTGRDECKLLGEIPAGNYKIISSGKRIIIGAKTSALISAGVDYFVKTYTNSYLSNTIIMKINTEVTQLYNPFTIPNERTDGTDVRIMSFNVLCELWDEQAKSTMADRNEKCTTVIRYYAPDVVGLQEMSDMWYSRFAKYMGSDYIITDKKTTTGKTNFSTLAYNPNTVKLLDHGVQIFSKGNNPQLRLATWAVFEKLSDGKQFIVMSTHWDLGKNPEYQHIHAVEMAELALQLQDKYNLPLITTGDYNSFEESEPYITFVEATKFTDSKYSAAKVLYKCITGHAIGTVPNLSPNHSIDHIFGNSKAEFLYFTVITDSYTSSASDHSPIMADVRLN